MNCCSLLFFLVITVASSVSASAEALGFIQCFENATSSDSVVYTPRQANFSTILLSYIRNLQFATPDTPNPLVIVTTVTPSHVQATVLCAKSCSLQVRTRSGGHDYEGLSFVAPVPFVLLDMSNIRDISIDLETETAWVESGATLGELYYSIAQKSGVLAFPGGICNTVGVGGHFSGGGYGNLMRKYGLSIDQMVDASIVDASGRILDRAAMGEDLFWAIRGGGGASFGVILRYKVNLVRVPESVTVFKLTKTFEHNAMDIIDQWLHLAAQDTLDREIFIRVVFSATSTVFYGLFLGDSGTLVDILHDKFPLLNLSTEDCVETSWVKSTLFWYDFPLNSSTEVILDRAPGSGLYVKIKSDYVKNLLPRSGLAAISTKLIQLGVPLSMSFNPYGGRMAEIASSATAFPHRAGNLWKIQYYAEWDNAADSKKYYDAINELYQFMTPYVSDSPRDSFLNYRDLDIGANTGNETDFFSYGRKYYGANFERLIRTKTAADPANFFQNEQSIPTQSSM
uniref:FAD-binding PCMH-type domain-containing protein n=1 Tax=Kalanchoe fedtschenkoi TaxID=63787 RepID=A0A7N0REA3_KALFE